MTKRYIEDVLPLGEINKYAQKGGGIGSLNAMHSYFACWLLTMSCSAMPPFDRQRLSVYNLNRL